MIKKLIMLSALLGILLFAGDVADADRPQMGAVRLEPGMMTADDFGLDLPDTSVANDTLFTRWVHDKNGDVSPWVCTPFIDVNQISSVVFTGKLYMVYANDTNDIFLVDSALTGAGVATFDTTYSELLSGYAYYRWYWISTDSNVIYNFGVMWSGYR